MMFSTFRKHHDLIRSTTSILTRETLLGSLFSEAEDGEELAAICMLLTGRISDPVTNLTTGIKEARVGKFLGLEGKVSILDFLPAIPASRHKDVQPYTVVGFLNALQDRCSDKDRTDVSLQALMSYVLHMGGQDALLGFEILCGKVSNGLNDLSLLYALCRWQDQGACMRGSSWDNNQKARIKGKFGLRPDISWWAKEMAVQHFLELLDAVEPQPGLPVAPMLCERVDKLQDVVESHGDMMFVQPKLDGQRIQIHLSPDEPVRLFTRELIDVTGQYPDLVTLLTLSLTGPGITSFILDGEMVAVTDDGDILPFDQLARRIGRKEDHDVVKVGVVLYDLLYLEGHSWVNEPYLGRRAALCALVDEGHRYVRVIEQKVARTVQDLQDSLQEAADRGEEGLVVKRPDSLYEAGNRSTEWVKLKPEYIEGMGLVDSVELAVVGFEKGRGKRHGRVGVLWLAALDDDQQRLSMVCKVGTGFKDEDLDLWTERLMPGGKTPIFPHLAPDVKKGDTKPQYTVKPQYVVEVKASEVTRSPTYPDGISLRFPRYVRERPDKVPFGVTTTGEIIKLQRP